MLNSKHKALTPKFTEYLIKGSLSTNIFTLIRSIIEPRQLTYQETKNGRKYNINIQFITRNNSKFSPLIFDFLNR